MSSSHPHHAVPEAPDHGHEHHGHDHAGHGLGDVAGLVLAWGGAFAGRLRPGARYTCGWKRASILAAFANALLLLVAMGSLAWEAIGRPNAPEPTQGFTVMVLAGGLSLWFGWAWLDPVASLVIALVIVAGTWRLFRHSVRLLFDGVPEHIDLAAVRSALEHLPGVDRVHDLHVGATSASDVVMTAHLVMPAGHPDDAFFEAATHLLRDRFRIDPVTRQGVRQPFMARCEGETAQA